MPAHFLLILSGRSKASRENTFCSEELGMSIWCLLNTKRGNHSSCSIFCFPPKLIVIVTLQPSFLLYLQYLTALFQTVAFTGCFWFLSGRLSDLPWARALLTTSLLVFACVDFYSTCIPEGLIHQIFTEDSLVQGAGLNTGRNLEMTKRRSYLPEAYNLVK